jgi:non-specific serine/threonine protein kinase
MAQVVEMQARHADGLDRVGQLGLSTMTPRSSPFGERLRELRRAARLTQEELAERAGVTAAAIGAIERGIRVHAYRRTVDALAGALGLTGEDRDAFRSLVAPPPRSGLLPVPAAGTMLPEHLTAFIGRGRVLARVRLLLERERLVTLAGPAGVGKTRLGMEAAASARPVFADGARMADLGQVLEAGLVGYVIARSLGLLPRSPGSPLPVIAARIGDARVLLIFDNCEHVLHEAAEAATSLLARCPNLVILATSRVPLHVPGEVVVPVDPLTPRESAALFKARAAAAAGYRPGGADRQAARQLLDQLDGLPLSIELAAAALRAFTPVQVLAQLEASLSGLALGSRVAAPRHRSLESAIGWSYDLLDADEQRLWRRLSVFAGGWELDAVTEVCSSPELPAGQVPTTLAMLADKSVVQRDGSGRFGMLGVVRLFGRRLLAASGEEAELVRRHRDWAAALAWPRLEVFWSPHEAAWLSRFETEQANLRAALGACIRAGDARAGLAIFTGLHGFWQARAGIGEGLRWFGAVIQPAGPDDSIRALALASAAWMRSVTGDLAGAMDAGREAERVARGAHDPAALAFALQYQGFAYLAGGQAGIAIGLADRALDLHRSARHEFGEFGAATALHQLALAHYAAGDRLRSRALAEEAVRLCQAAGNQRIAMAASILLALLAWLDGEADTAARLARDSLAAAGGAADRWNIARALQLLAWTSAASGRAGRAAALFGASRALLDSLPADSDLARLPSQRESENQARQALGDSGYMRLLAEGYHRPLPNTLRYALDEAI